MGVWGCGGDPDIANCNLQFANCKFPHRRILPHTHTPILPHVTALIALVLSPGTGCRRAPGRPQVVVYCSLDEPYAAPVLKEYARRSGVEVVPLYDTEAAKSVGLAQRIRAEAGRP